MAKTTYTLKVRELLNEALVPIGTYQPTNPPVIGCSEFTTAAIQWQATSGGTAGTVELHLATSPDNITWDNVSFVVYKMTLDVSGTVVQTELVSLRNIGYVKVLKIVNATSNDITDVKAKIVFKG